MGRKTVGLSAVVFIFLPLLSSKAQDVDVPGNLTMRDSTAMQGNILKGGILFLHNFGTANTFLGSSAGNLTMSGAFNTAGGVLALGNNTTGFNNTATGSGALADNTTGYYNTASGSGALFGNTTGAANTASGLQALQSNSTGNQNTASGLQALGNNTTGSFNSASGTRALFRNTTGSFNTASGGQALFNNTTGELNTASGFNALVNNTGSYNTATGAGALHENTGNYNTASGLQALSGNTTGDRNTAVGYNADVSTGNLTNATAIGAGAVVDASNRIRLGDDNVTVIEGLVGFTANSDRNRQENFQPVRGEDVLTKIRRLSLTSWNFIGHDPKQFRHYGPMAQDFFAAFGHDGIGTIGTETTITSTDIDGILMIAAQALEKRSVEQKKELEALRGENADLKARLNALERRIGNDALTRAEYLLNMAPE